MQPSNATGNGSGSPVAGTNPLLQSYQAWSERTPFVTRTTCIALVILFIFSFFIKFDIYLSDIPFFTVYHFEIYRIFLSPFIGNSILFLVLLLFTFPTLGLKMESTMGSGYFLWLLMMINLVTNFLFNTVCITLAMFGTKEALYWNCSNFWLILFALITIECLQVPDVPRRLLCLPVDIPSKYMPLALYGIMCLFSGFTLSYFISMCLGYAYFKGYLDQLKPTSYYLESLEQQGGILHSISRSRGWVLAGGLGHDAFLAVNQQGNNDPMSSRRLLGGGEESSSHGASGGATSRAHISTISSTPSAGPGAPAGAGSSGAEKPKDMVSNFPSFAICLLTVYTVYLLFCCDCI